VSDGWYYLGSQGHIGPLSLQELKRTLADFPDGKDVLVWHEGFPGWERAGDVPELKARTSLPPQQIGSRRDGEANPKLPLWDTICLSYSAYFHNFWDVLRISWLWLAVAAPLAAIVNWLQFSWMAGVMADMKRGMPASMPLEATVLQNVVSLVFMFAGLSIAVAWHRALFWANILDLAAAMSPPKTCGVTRGWGLRSV
jgi:GYF domain 2